MTPASIFIKFELDTHSASINPPPSGPTTAYNNPLAMMSATAALTAMRGNAQTESGSPTAPPAAPNSAESSSTKLAADSHCPTASVQSAAGAPAAAHTATASPIARQPLQQPLWRVAPAGAVSTAATAKGRLVTVSMWSSCNSSGASSSVKPPMGQSLVETRALIMAQHLPHQPPVFPALKSRCANLQCTTNPGGSLYHLPSSLLPIGHPATFICIRECRSSVLAASHRVLTAPNCTQRVRSGCEGTFAWGRTRTRTACALLAAP